MTTQMSLPAAEDSALKRCRICGSHAVAVLWPRIKGTSFRIVRCAGCRAQSLEPQPAPDALRRIYEAAYYRSWGMSAGENPVVARLKRRTFQRRVKELKSYIACGRILDVGTATGFFLEVAEELGFDPYGVELSNYAGGIAAAKFGRDRIHIGPLETAPFTPGTFDAIAMSDLLEHVADPVATLRLCYGLLKPEGAVIITTPNTDSLSCRLMGSKWVHYKMEHLFYLGPVSVRVMAGLAGFRVALCRGATKALSVDYLRNQLHVYRHWALTPLLQAAAAISGPFSRIPIDLRVGEMVVVLLKAREGARPTR